MASTRNNNTPGNYCQQQSAYAHARQETIYKHSAYGEAYDTKWAGNGLNPGQLRGTLCPKTHRILNLFYLASTLLTW